MRSASPLVALAILALAVGLRLMGLGSWSLDGDEVYSWFDVERLLAGGEWPHGARTHPLVYLGMAGMASLFGTSELVLRSLPALCGMGAVALLLFGRRDAVPRGQALVAGLLAALSPWLVYVSQAARFYGPLLLFSVAATLAALPGPGRRPVWAGVMLVLAALCHPSALLLAPALLLPLCGPPLRWRPLLGLAAGGVLVALVLLLTDDGALAMVVERFMDGVDPTRYDLPHFVLGLGYNVGPVVGLLALGGLLAAREGGGPDRVLVGGALLPPALLVLLALLGFSTHQRYAMASMPAVLLLAGAGVGWLARRRRWAGGLAVLLALAAATPGLVAHIQDGNRHDQRLLAAVVAERVGPDDVIIADEHAPLWLYLQRHAGMSDVVFLEDTLVTAAQRRDLLANRRMVWVALKQSRLGGHYDRTFMDWIDQNFVEVTQVGRAPPPLVRHDNRYVLYRRGRRLTGGRRRRQERSPWA